MTDLEVPFGFRLSDRRMVSIEAVGRGLECGCTCPACGDRLVGVKGEVKVHHFRHYAGDTHCHGARESALHQFAKQIICDELHIGLPGKGNAVLGRMIRAEPEKDLGGLRPDVLATFRNETVAIEIYVTHRVPIEKVREIHRRRLCTLEVDLSYHGFAGMTEYNLRQAVLTTARRRWIYEPDYIQRGRQAALEQAAFAVATAQAEAEERRQATARARQEEARAIALARQEEAYAASVRVNAWRLEEAERLERLAVEAAKILEQRQAEEAVRVQERAWRQAAAEQRRAEREPPNLQALVEAYAVTDSSGKMIGGYERIPPEAWAEYDAKMEVFRCRMRGF